MTGVREGWGWWDHWAEDHKLDLQLTAEVQQLCEDEEREQKTCCPCAQCTCLCHWPPWWVYFLIDPDSKLVRYIGVTGNPKSRIASHFSSKQTAQRAKLGWIESLQSQGRRPKVLFLQFASQPVARFAERYYILRFAARRHPLFNSYSAGGELNILLDESMKVKEEFKKEFGFYPPKMDVDGPEEHPQFIPGG